MTGRSAAFCLTLITVCASLCSAQSTGQNQAEKTGSVCVLPNPAERPTRISPGGDYNPDTLKLQIDKRSPISWPHKAPGRIDHLSLNERHLSCSPRTGSASSPSGSRSRSMRIRTCASPSTGIRVLIWETLAMRCGARQTNEVVGREMSYR